MRRSTVIANRTTTVVVGLVSVAAAVGGFLWFFDVVTLSDPLRPSWARNVADQSWYVPATAIAGAVLVLLGLRLLFSNLRHDSVGDVPVPSDEKRNNLRVDLSAATSAACSVFEGTLGVRSAKAAVNHEKGNIVCTFRIAIDPGSVLKDVATDCERVLGEFRQCVAQDNVHARVVVTNVARRSSLSRAH